MTSYEYVWCDHKQNNASCTAHQDNLVFFSHAHFIASRDNAVTTLYVALHYLFCALRRDRSRFQGVPRKEKGIETTALTNTMIVEKSFLSPRLELLQFMLKSDSSTWIVLSSSTGMQANNQVFRHIRYRLLLSPRASSERAFYCLQDLMNLRLNE